MKSLRFLIGMCLIVLCAPNLRAATSESSNKQEPSVNHAPIWVQKSWKSLYTQINLSYLVRAEDSTLVVDSLDRFFQKFTRKFQSRSSLDSVIYNAKQGEIITLDSLSYEVFEYAYEKYLESDGLIHPGVGNLITLWGLEWGHTPRVPTDLELQKETEQLQSLFYRLIPQKRAVQITQPQVHPLFGSFTKGMAIDSAAGILNSLGVKHFLLEIGGDLIAQGLSAKSKPWVIGVKDPFHKNELLLALALSSPQHLAMASSGGYEQYFEVEGKKYHHILNPQSGRPASEMASVSILTKRAIDADYLATRLFVMGYSKAKEFLKSNPEILGVIISPKGEIWVSPKLQSSVKRLK